jgi:Na+-translocating ferredoxin:NAD+ oxidoreductase subunit B
MYSSANPKRGIAMKSSDAIYQRLQHHLDQMPIAFPATKTGIELRLLKHLFSPEEAEIALALSAVPEPVEKIHRRLKGTRIPIEALRADLARMAAKGAIMAGRGMRGGKPVPAYGKAPLVVGMFEFQVNHLTKEFMEDFHAYQDEAGSPILTKKTSQMRTVPINTRVGEPGAIGRYDDIRGYVHETRGPFGVMNCVCRQAQNVMGHSCMSSENSETCLTIGGAAVYMQKLGHARLVLREEMLAILDRAERDGLVLQPQNTQSPDFICCCCKDCCEVLKNARKLSRPAELFKTNFQAHVDAERCTGCATCVKRCPMDAVTVSDNFARVDGNLCIGCGLCASSCKEEAMRLRPRDGQVIPPPDQRAMYQKIMRERYGPLRMIAKRARIMLGMKS